MSGSDKCYNRSKWVGDSDRGTILPRVIREGLSVEMTFEYRPENVRKQAMKTHGRTLFQKKTC